MINEHGSYPTIVLTEDLIFGLVKVIGPLKKWKHLDLSHDFFFATYHPLSAKSLGS